MGSGYFTNNNIEPFETDILEVIGAKKELGKTNDCLARH